MKRESAAAALIAVLASVLAVGACKGEPAPAEKPQPVAVADAGPAAPPPPPFPRAKLLTALAKTSGPVARATWGSREVLFLADADDSAVITLDASTLEVITRTPASGAPSALTITSDALFVALRDTSSVLELHAHATDVGTFERARTVPTRAEPVALAATDTELLVLSAQGRSLERFSLASLEATKATLLAREPRSLLLLPDGTAVVGHASRGPLSIVTAAGAVDGMDMTEPRICTESTGDECMTISDIEATQHFALGELDGRVVVLGSLSTTAGAGSSYGGGGGDDLGITKAFRDRQARAVNVGIDLVSISDKKIINGADRRRPGRCSLPRAMVVDRERKEVVIACMGDQHLSRYALVKIGKEWLATSVVESVPLAGAPSALSVETASGDVTAWAREARTLTRYTRTKGKLTVGATRALTPEKPLDPTWKRGREVFHLSDAHISTLGFSCAHCHPDGHDDDVVWSTPRGKRRPMSLVDLPETGPYGWDSQSPTLERHVKDTITIHLAGAGLSQPDMDALLTYVRSLHRTGTKRVGDGEKAFEKADCSKCHDPGRGYGDGTPHLLAKDVNVRTPRLFALGGRRTYFHDGRYASLDALLDDRTVSMGEPGALSPDERKALVGFLESL